MEYAKFGRSRIYGTTTKGQKFQCGGDWTGCDELHTFFKPEDVLCLTDAMRREDLESDPHWQPEKLTNALIRGTLFASQEFIVPTLLGDWWEDASVN